MSEQKRTIYEFADFRLDVFRRALERLDGVPVPLKPKALDLLIVLVERHGETVSKEDLLKLAWPDSFVEEGNLMVHMSLLRKALGDNTDQPRFIVTVSGKGYRFVANVKETSVGAADIGAEIARHRPSPFSYVAISSGVIAALLLAVGLFWFLNRTPAKADLFTDVRLTMLTSSGAAVSAAISPDGRYVAYVVQESETQYVRLKQVGDSTDLQIIDSGILGTVYHGLTFSPDSKTLYFLRTIEPGTVGLYRTSALGGRAEKLAEDVDSPPGISPDGATLAFVRGLPDQKETAVFTVGAEGGEPKKLAGLPAEQGFVLFARPAWSANGKKLFCPVKKQDDNGRYGGLVSLEAANGDLSEVATPRLSEIAQAAWLPEMKGLIVVGKNKGSEERNQLWQIDLPRGTLRRITNDLNDYRDLTLSADAKTIVTVITDLQSNIWLAPLSDTGVARQITTANRDGNDGLAWTPDGDLIYTSRSSDHVELWRHTKDAKDSRDGGKKQITVSSGNNFQPAVSPDGKTIAFVSDRDGADRIWLMNSGDGTARKLTDGADDGAPAWSPDGKTIAYRSYINGNPLIYRIGVDGGELYQLTTKISGRPQFSPDGEKILVSFRAAALSAPKLSVISAASGGEPETVFNVSGPLAHWTDDGKAFLFIRGAADNNMNIWRQPADPNAEPERVTNFTGARIFWFDVSPDGKTLAFAQGGNLSDVVLISDNSEQK